MSTTLFDIEHLQQITYERSKIWSCFLDTVAENENELGIDLDIFDSSFDVEEGHNEDDDDSLASMEDDACDEIAIDEDVLRNVTNKTCLSLILNNKTMALPESTVLGVNDENQKLVDFFNETMPIINEHNRQLKETGFDRILNTFDKKKIEEKVGSWLNRHNSLYGGDTTLTSAVSKAELYEKGRYQSKDYYESSKSYRNHYSKEDDGNDSDDSLHSGETARYIRSSKASALKTASTTTMIKTYRTIKSKREALREKYACEQDDDETHLRAIRHRRRVAKEHEYHHNHYEHVHSQRSYKHHQKYTTPSNRLEKRKVFRKRTTSSNSSNFDSSSDSDSYYYDKDKCNMRKKCKCCMKVRSKPPPRFRGSAIKMQSGRSNRVYYYSQCLSKSASSSSSTSFICERREKVKRNSKLYKDKRPCRLESECRCCNEKLLCQDYKHVVDTSTEEWLVENCFSPKKDLKITGSKAKAEATTVTKSLPPLQEKEQDEPKKKTRNNTNHIETTSNQKITRNGLKKTIESKASTTKNNKQVSTTSTVPDETFEIELQMAIEASKKIYEMEQKNKMKETANDGTKAKESYKTKPQKPLRKLPKRKGKKCQEDTIDETEHKRQINENTDQTAKSNEYDEDVNIENDLGEKKLCIKPKSTGSEETFFAPALEPGQAICNSTAFNNDTLACRRQFPDPPPKNYKDNSKKQKEVEVSTKSINDTKKQLEIISVKTLRKLPRYNTEEDGLTDKLLKDETINRKRQTIKNSSVICKNDIIKEKLPQLIENDDNLSDDEPSSKIVKHEVETSKNNINSTVTNTKITVFDSNSKQLICNSTAMANTTKAQICQLDYSQNNKSNCQLDDSQNNKNNTSKKQDLVNETINRNQANIEIANETTIPRTDTEKQTETKALCDDDIFVKPLPGSVKEKVKLLKKTKNSTSINSEASFFYELNRNQLMCNSTALSKTTEADKRKFTDSLSNKKQNVVNDRIIHRNENNTIILTNDTTVPISENGKKYNNKAKTTLIKGTKGRIRIIEHDSSDEEVENFGKAICEKQSTRIEKYLTDEEAENVKKRDDDDKKSTKKLMESKNSSKLSSSNLSQITNNLQTSTTQFSDTLCTRDETHYRNNNNNKTKEYKKKQDRTTKTTVTDTKEMKNKKIKMERLPVTSTNISQKMEITKKSTAAVTVTSTTSKRSPETNSFKNVKIKKEIIELPSSSDELSDCTMVSSTTNIEQPPTPPTSKVDQTMQPQTSTQLSSSLAVAQEQQRKHSTVSSRMQNKTLPSNLNHHHVQHNIEFQKGILVYAPENRSMLNADNFSNDGNFIITREHLSSIIGEKPAEKFLKYYTGRRRFNSNSKIYFQPPSTGVLGANVCSSSSESDDDLERLDHYGDLYESFMKTTISKNSNKKS